MMIASIGPNLPHDALIATGRYAGPLPVDPDRETPRAAQWLESKFAPWAFSVLEAWFGGELDGHEAIVFSRADDTAQRLYYYVCELQRRGALAGPEPVIFDVAKIARSSSVDRTVESVRTLCRRFEVDEAELEEGIAEANRRRTAQPSLPEGRRCLIAGTPPPDRRLHASVEDAGFAAVGEVLADDWGRLGGAVREDSADPAVAIGTELHREPHGPRSFASSAQLLADRIVEIEAQAVVLWRIEEDEAQAWHLPQQRRALADVGVPALVLVRRDWRARDGAPNEIARFLQEIPA